MPARNINHVYASIDECRSSRSSDVYSVPIDDAEEVEHIYESVEEVKKKQQQQLLQQTEVKLRQLSMGSKDASSGRKAFHRRSLQVSSRRLKELEDEEEAAAARQPEIEEGVGIIFRHNDQRKKHRRRSMILESKFLCEKY